MRCRDFERAHLDEVLAFLEPVALSRAWTPSRMGQSRAMFALFEEAGKFLGGPRAVGGRGLGAGRARHRQARQGQGAPTSLLTFEKPAPAELIAEAQALAADHRPRPGLGIRARGRIRLRRPGARLLQRQGHAGAAGRRAVRACSRRRTTSAAPARAASRRRRPRSCSRRWPRIEKKKQRAGADRRLGRASWPPASCPAPVREQLYKILFKPDKNAPEYKAVVEASRATQHGAAGAAAERPARSTRPTSSTGSASCSRTSPRARASRRCRRPAITRRRCRWPTVQAFSIDDSSTTEIDDALSVQGLGSGTVTRRHPHRGAGPGAAAGQRRSTRWRAQRLSTVYMPGYKITMLPDDVVQAYTLQEGRDCPAVSLYVDLRRSHAGAARHRDAAGARADRRQPAARPARRRRHRGLAGRRRPPPTAAPEPRGAPARAAVLPVPAGAST